MDPAEFRRHGHDLVEWIAEYLAGSERYPVLPHVSPGDVRDALPPSPPEQGEPFSQILADFDAGKPVMEALKQYLPQRGDHRGPQGQQQGQQPAPTQA